ncbi:MAG: hypothetical protein VB934_21160, partial [Polyangiaceae bacterium]
SSKRWHCTKCDHVWDDPHAGPSIPSRFAEDDPRPVFYLKRTRSGMGGVWGFSLGCVLVILSKPEVSNLLLVGGGVVAGGLLGRWYTYTVCSDPQCRARMRASDRACPQCKKTIAGAITRAPEHFAAVAEVRREFTALREREA